MPRNNSPEDIERQHLEAMGEPLGSLYHALYNETVWIHAKWSEYRKLFGHSEDRIILLNETAGFFFHVIQRTMWDDTLLHLSRLTDPPKQGRYENLTVRRLPGIIPEKRDKEKLDRLVKDFYTQTEFARDWRNRKIAHSELSLSLDDGASPLHPASREHVENALGSLRSILNYLQKKFVGGVVAFEHFLSHDDADSLVYALNFARFIEARRRERIGNSRTTPEDFEFPRNI
jgi:hypothetical protein